MTLGIYKPGQGYWTRVMTAAGVAMVALSGVAWLWPQLEGLHPTFDPVYLQAGVTSVILIVTTALLYWIVAVNAKSVEFFIATEGEMQKVNWSSRREVMGSTWVVIGVSMVIAMVLFVTDFGFAKFFQSIKVLESVERDAVIRVSASALHAPIAPESAKEPSP